MPGTSRRLAIRGLVRLACERWRTFMCLCVLTTASVLLALALPQIISRFIDEVLVSERPSDAPPFLALLLALMIAGAAVDIVRGGITARVANEMIADLQMLLFWQAQRLPLAVLDKQSPGETMSRMTNDVEEVQAGLMETVQMILVNAVLIGGLVVALALMSPTLALVTLAPVPIAVFLSRRMAGRLELLFSRLWRKSGELSAGIHEALGRGLTIRAFHAQAREGARLERLARRRACSATTAERAWATWLPLFHLLLELPSLAIWWKGANDIAEQHLTLGDFVAYLSYQAMLFGPLRSLGSIQERVGRCLSAAQRVFGYLSEQAADPAESGDRPTGQLDGAIELCDVSFAYDDSKSVLRSVSGTIPSGVALALVGPSGAGKSTLAKIIAGLYTPTAGRVALGPAAASTSVLSQRVCYVGADAHILNDSVAENVSYAEVRDEVKIVTCGVAACVHQVVARLPLAYDTFLRTPNSGLSTGEQQRVVVARALYRDPPTLIFDESTNGVDSEVQVELIRRVWNARSSRTTVWVSHRADLLGCLDYIALLSADGRFSIERQSDSSLLQEALRALLRVSSTSVRSVGWLPRGVLILRTKAGTVTVDGPTEFRGELVAATRLFPITSPTRCIQLVVRDERGSQLEGVISDLDTLGREAHAVVSECLASKPAFVRVRRVIGRSDDVEESVLIADTSSGTCELRFRRSELVVDEHGSHGWVLHMPGEAPIHVPQMECLDAKTWRLTRDFL